MSKRLNVIKCALVVASLLVASPARAASILFLEVDTAPYHPDGLQLAAMLTAGGNTVTYRLANAAIYNDYSSFNQVWVYDLSAGADNSANEVGNYNNVAAWYNGLASANQNLIVDGRIISSGPNWAGGSGEVGWIQNYATQLAARGGGLVLGTDHFDYHSGINTINAGINIGLFTGFSNLTQAAVDPLSPLSVPVTPCSGAPALNCINDNSTTGFVPTGLQTNGQFLTPVAYHGTSNSAFSNAAVASTIGSATFGTDPGVVPEPATWTLLGLGLASLGAGRLRKRRTERP